MWKKINPKQLDGNVFSMLDDQWMLVTAGSAEKCNTMTASWGGLGVLWNRNVATCYIRPQRYTKEFLDANEYFTLAFFGEAYRRAMSLCGSKSGRDVDKIRECGFTVVTGEGGAPYFDEAELVLVCRKRFIQAMDPANIPEEIKHETYGAKDYHFIYIGEIVEALLKE